MVSFLLQTVSQLSKLFHFTNWSLIVLFCLNICIFCLLHSHEKGFKILGCILVLSLLSISLHSSVCYYSTLDKFVFSEIHIESDRFANEILSFVLIFQVLYSLCFALPYLYHSRAQEKFLCGDGFMGWLGCVKLDLY